MVLCKFYLQGTCRYGASCRFEHTQPVYNSNFNPMLRQQQPQPRGPSQSIQINTAMDLSEMVQKDLQISERGGQWLLSCYCPLPSKAILLPGLDDHSPDELRCLMYQAQSVGNIEPYRQHIQKLYQDALSARGAFKSPSRESMAVLEKIRTSPVHSTVTQPNPFESAPTGSSGGSIFGGSVQSQMSVFAGGSPQPSVFGGATTSANPFGGATTSASPFGGATTSANPFGGATTAQPGIFSGSTAPPPNPFVGGNASQASIFGGGNPAPPNPFGGATAAPATPFGTPSQPSAVPGSVFGNAYAPPAQGSLFGGGAGAAGSIFGGSPGGGQEPISSFSFAAAAQGIQAGAQNQSFLGSPAPQATPFVTANNVQPAGSIFGGSAQPATQSVLGGTSAAAQPMPQPAASSASVNPFGTTISTQPSMAAVANDLLVHTPLNELTEGEKAEFIAPTFSHGRLPLRPPPKELCA